MEILRHQHRHDASFRFRLWLVRGGPREPEPRDDIGAFAALAFEHPGKWENRTFSLAGDELSMQRIADAFSRVTAKDVKYVQVPWDQFEKTMGQEMTVMYRWFEEEGFHFNIEQVRREYPLTYTFDRWLEANWNTTAVAAR